MNKIVGKPVNRVDGRLKVTGGAKYVADVPMAGMVHAVLVSSTIAKGRIRSMDSLAAESAPGVLTVITHQNVPKLYYPDPIPADFNTVRPDAVRVLDSPEIYYWGQWVGVVVANTLEQAEAAASLVKIDYDIEKPVSDFMANINRAYMPGKINGNRDIDTNTGDPDSGMNEAAVSVDETYLTATEHHNPMEPSACTAVWSGGNLTIYDTSQSVYAARDILARTFNLPEERVRVICPYLGGGFGCKVTLRSHSAIAAVAAQRVNRPVKLVVSRKQMYSAVGHRPTNYQRVRLGATNEGRLTAIIHDATIQTATNEEWIEHTTAMTRMLYQCANRRTTHRGLRLNLGTPTIMRGPGEVPGSFALESAMDELAYALNLDPIKLRNINYAQSDPESGLPWSSNSLRECYKLGAEKFGWNKRNPEPGSMQEGNELIGYGTATATRAVNLAPASAKAQLKADGTLLIRTASHDIGTGTYTVLTQIAADVLGIERDRIEVMLGDTSLPYAPVAGGSMTAASVGSAVQIACQNLRDRLTELSQGNTNNLAAKANSKSYQNILAQAGKENVEVLGEYDPDDARERYSMHTFGAQFCEVRIDPELGIIRIPRFLGVYSAGRILNAKTARSQFIGGIVGGIGMGLLEETHIDPNHGNYVNANLGEYLLPVNADIQNIEAIWIEETDPHVNPLGIKGIGETSIVGVGAAIANAVYHATGKRVREAPITLDKLL